MTAIETITDEVTKLQPMYRVLLHNDDVNDMMHVSNAIQEVFHFDCDKANSIMMEAHNEGVALCKIEPLEPAEFHQEQLQSFGLVSTIEPE